jgi:RHH-type transcriptional regulator, rel operon repressor / antitoxin RelB
MNHNVFALNTILDDMMPAKADTFSVRLPDDVKTQIDALAKLTHRSRSFIVKEAVSVYMRERSEYIRELDAAVKSAENGIGHSGDQIFGWLKSWGSDAELPSPQPDILPAK